MKVVQTLGLIRLIHRKANREPFYEEKETILEKLRQAKAKATVSGQPFR